MAAPILLTNFSQKTKAIVIVTLLVVFYLLFGFGLYTCGRSNDEPRFTKSARIGMTLVDLDSDTTKPTSHQDSIKRQNDFVNKFNDSMTWKYFDRWMYRRVSGMERDTIVNLINPYLRAYLIDRWNDFNKQK